LTYDQIVRKQATAFGDVLVGVPGLVLLPPSPPSRPGWTVSSAGSGCVSYLLDGKPLSVSRPQIVVGTPGSPVGPGSSIGTATVPDSPDQYIDANDVGAVEFYESSERPAQFGSDRCALVVVWTRTGLGLPATAQVDTAGRH
jgi:hypothetical protein